MSGELSDNEGNGRISLKGYSPMIVLQFAEGWSEQLATLSRGANVTVRGKMTDADVISIDFEECELI